MTMMNNNNKLRTPFGKHVVVFGPLLEKYWFGEPTGPRKHVTVVQGMLPTRVFRHRSSCIERATPTPSVY